MEDPRVVAGLVGRELGLLLEDREAKAGPGLEQPERRRETDESRRR